MPKSLTTTFRQEHYDNPKKMGILVNSILEIIELDPDVGKITEALSILEEVSGDELMYNREEVIAQYKYSQAKRLWREAYEKWVDTKN